MSLQSSAARGRAVSTSRSKLSDPDTSRAEVAGPQKLVEKNHESKTKNEV